MTTSPKPFPTLHRALRLALALVVCSQVLSAAAQDRSEKLRIYHADEQACQSGASGQTLDACMKEARAVLARSPTEDPSVNAEQRVRNSMGRCEAQTGDDRTACLARMRGEGSVSGSVSGGGMLRELVTH